MSSIDIKDPIFIVGCPRSGSTALASILNKHPNIATSSETHFFNYLKFTKSFREGTENEFTENVINELLKDTRFADFCSIGDINPSIFIGKISEANFFRLMMESLLSKKKKQRFLDKTPQHLKHIEEIHKLFPQAKFINLVRDGRDCVNSLLKMPWRPGGIVNNARFWRQYIKLGLKYENKYPDNFISLKYEDLVQNPENSLKSICDFLEETYHPDMLKGETNSSIFAEWESDWKSKANDELDPSRAGIWEEELHQDDAILLNIALKEYLLKLGYKIDEDKYPAKANHYFELFLEYVRLAGNKILRSF